VTYNYQRLPALS